MLYAETTQCVSQTQPKVNLARISGYTFSCVYACSAATPINNGQHYIGIILQYGKPYFLDNALATILILGLSEILTVSFISPYDLILKLVNICRLHYHINKLDPGVKSEEEKSRVAT